MCMCMCMYINYREKKMSLCFTFFLHFLHFLTMRCLFPDVSPVRASEDIKPATDLPNVALIVGDNLLQDHQLATVLEKYANVTLIERSLNIPVDIILDGSTGLIVQTLSALESEECTKSMADNLLRLHVVFDKCWLIFKAYTEKGYVNTSLSCHHLTHLCFKGRLPSQTQWLLACSVSLPLVSSWFLKLPSSLPSAMRRLHSWSA